MCISQNGLDFMNFNVAGYSLCCPAVTKQDACYKKEICVTGLDSSLGCPDLVYTALCSPLQAPDLSAPGEQLPVTTVTTRDATLV
ncbi:hypothetical protein CB1_000904004 [Camelus ferus]|nr:hypothetical protein CB1_000904004 [Camelus ferus]